MATTSTATESAAAAPNVPWQTTACILCSINCGLEIKVEDRQFVKIRGDKSNPRSKGYVCEKPARLNFYQNHNDRLTSPLRRRADGSFEEIDWDTAIAEVASKLAGIRDQFGGEKIMYYGGGGQGNHLGGAYSAATRRALGMRYQSNALAQEKTGEFWVERQMFGGRPEPDFAQAQVSVFVGKNPWHSHGFERARITLREIHKDPSRQMIVIDPRRTETAELADVFLQVRPGTDAFILAAMLGVLVQESLIDETFLKSHATGGDELLDVLAAIPVDEFTERAGVEPHLVREAARIIGRSESVSVIEDLGIEMAPHSTLNSYLEKLLYVLTGNLGKAGGMNLGTHLGKLIGTSKDNRKSPVGGHRIITGLIPCNAIPDEILSDHADRFRAMIIESGNPVHSLADSPRMREALDALELVVVIDVAMTETAQHADYILPAASQFEKMEATFFGGGFPDHVFQLRHRLLEPLEGTLPEPEIHRRICRALGAYSDDDLTDLREAAKVGLDAFAFAVVQMMASRPDLAGIAPILLYESLGPELGEGKEAAALIWGAAQQLAASHADSVKRAGFGGDPPVLGNELFQAILDRREGVVITVDPYEETFQRIRTGDGRVQLHIPELIQELRDLESEQPTDGNDEYPFVLSAGERRGNTANTIYRNPAWRKKDPDGSLRMSPTDASRLGIDTGDQVRISTKRGAAIAHVEVSDTMREGHVSLPNGLGVSYVGDDGTRTVYGTPPNELTSGEDRDWIAGTPWHKHVRARIEAIREN